MDGMTDRPCLALVRDGLRWGVTADGRRTHWLPYELWAAAEDLDRRMRAMNEAAGRVEALWREAQDAAWDAVPGVLPRA